MRFQPKCPEATVARGAGRCPFLFSCRSTAWGELPAGLNLRLPGGS